MLFDFLLGELGVWLMVWGFKVLYVEFLLWVYYEIGDECGWDVLWLLCGLIEWLCDELLNWCLE